MRFVSGASHYQATVLCQSSLCCQHHREDPSWHSHTFLYISRRSQSEARGARSHGDLSSVENVADDGLLWV